LYKILDDANRSGYWNTATAGVGNQATAAPAAALDTKLHDMLLHYVPDYGHHR